MSVQQSAVFLGSDCPARGHRVKSGPPRPSLRDGYATLDLAAPHKGLALTKKMAEEQDGATINRLEIEIKLRLHVISLGSHRSYVDLKVALRIRTRIGKSHAADRIAIS
jgi:hypothetical protein